jgi:hypothetical protein
MLLTNFIEKFRYWVKDDPQITAGEYLTITDALLQTFINSTLNEMVLANEERFLKEITITTDPSTPTILTLPPTVARVFAYREDTNDAWKTIPDDGDIRAISDSEIYNKDEWATAVYLRVVEFQEIYTTGEGTDLDPLVYNIPIPKGFEDLLVLLVVSKIKGSRGQEMSLTEQSIMQELKAKWTTDAGLVKHVVYLKNKWRGIGG